MSEFFCSRVFNEFYELMTHDEFTDVSFEVGKSTFRAHRVVLAASSPVFKAMFSTEMKEAETRQVVLTDVDKSAFQTFLNFVYTMDSTSLGDHLYAMYMLADKYAIKSLALACDETVIRGLSVAEETKPAVLIGYLIILDQYGRTETKDVVLNYVREYFRAVLLDDDCISALGSRPSLLKEVTQAAIAEKGKKFHGIEGVWCLRLNERDVERIIKEPTERTFPQSDKTQKTPRTLVNGQSRVTVDVSFKSSTGLLFAYVYLGKELLNAKELILNIETIVRIQFKTYVKKYTTVVVPEDCRCLKLLALELNSLGEYAGHFTYITIKVNLSQTGKVRSPTFPTYERFIRSPTDAVLVVQSTRFPVHKKILAEKSKYFDDLFEEPSEEYRIEGEYPSPESFSELLDFIYFDRHPAYNCKNAQELLIVGHKFGLLDVVDNCVPILSAKISILNACELLISGDELNLEELKSAALNYIKKNKVQIFHEVWEKLKTRHRLLQEVLLHITTI